MELLVGGLHRLTLKEGDKVKDPKQILDSWRTDIKSHNLFSNLLMQFDLEYPNSGKNRKKPIPKRHLNRTVATLSLCLVTGLTVGAGSAFAESEWGKDTPPLDQPASKVGVQAQPPRAEDRSVEQIIQDRPTENGTGKDFQQLKPDVPVQEKQTERRSLNNANSVLDRPSESREDQSRETQTKQPDHQLQSGQHQELPPKSNTSPHATDQSKEASSKAAKHSQTYHYVPPVRTVQGHEQSEGSKYSASRSEMQYASGATHSPDVTANSKQPSEKLAAEPKTVNGGALPKTASGDLNGVVFGGAAALLGSAYTMFRGRKDQA